MSVPQEPPVFSKITQVKSSLHSIINGDFTETQKENAQQVLNNIEDYKGKFQTSLDTFSNNIDKQYSQFTACKSLGINKTTTLISQLCSTISTLATGAFLDNLVDMNSVNELVSYLDEHLSYVLDLITYASNSATTFSSLINQANNTLQTLFSDVAFLMSSLNDVENQILGSLDNCISFLRYNDNLIDSKFKNLETISQISDTKNKIDKVKEIANNSFNSNTESISNSALNIIERLS